MSNESFPRASEGQGEQEEVIICQGKGFCSASLPAFIFNSGSLCRHFFFFFLIPYSCCARSCIFLAKCSLLARSAARNPLPEN